MARIFNVTLTQETSYRIVAESEDDLHKALQDADFEDWDLPALRWSIDDPLAAIKTIADVDRVKDDPKQPDMGVLHGEVVAWCDARAGVPNLMDLVTDEIKAVKARISSAATNLPLFKEPEPPKP